MQEKNLRFETLAIHAGHKPDKETGACAVPIYQTAAYCFNDSDHAGRLFALEENGNIYARINNPTQKVLEQRAALLEGGVGALALASGQAAITLAILNIAGQGDEVVAASTLYGGSYNLLANTLPRFGVTTRFVNPVDPENFRRAITPKTKLIFGETIGNPNANVLDIEPIADIAHKAGIPLIVDNTFASPYLCRPFEFGADIVVHSATKFICGHGTSMGGIIIDSGKFDWNNGKFPALVQPDESYHGIEYVKTFGPEAYITKARVQMLRDLGPAISPFNAFLLLQGLETLTLRMEQHCSNSLETARYLEGHPLVNWVEYPGLPSNANYSLAKKYLPRGAGSIFTFGLKGGLKAGKRFIDSLKIFSHLANVGDAKSLVVHPASTTHQQLDAEGLKAAGITPDLIRISVGIENINDLLDDLEQALNKSQK